MLTFIDILVTVTLVPFFLYLALVTTSAIVWGRRRARTGSGSVETLDLRPGKRFRFLIPAHDEEANIASTVRSCLEVTYDPDQFQVVVIADNCTDRTAEMARGAGAIVVERTDPERRSKGFALAAYFEQQARLAEECDAVVLIDADTVVDPGILTALAGALKAGQDWIQCYYTVRNPDASWRTQLMTYAFSLFNGVWLLGQDCLGLGVGLKGNGMCFTTQGLQRHPWRAHGLTEDLEFSWMLRLAGERPRFLATTRVYGAMVSRGGRAAATQRRRWEAGRKALRRTFLGPIVRSTRLGLLAKLLYLADLVFPPLTTLLLGLITAAGLTCGVGLFASGHDSGLVRGLWEIHGAMALVLVGYALSPFWVLSLPVRYLLSLVALPYYAVWKLLITTRSTPTAWVRTAREPLPGEAMG